MESPTTKTYDAEQVEERGKEVMMLAGEQLLGALRAGQTFSSERVTALADAMSAGSQMVAVSLELGPPATP